MFHGNAGNIGYRLPIARILHDELGCHVLMVQYRGYGLSTGKPDEKGLTLDAQAGLDYIRFDEELRNTKVVVYGQSLGGAVGTGLAVKAQREIKEGEEKFTDQPGGEIAGLILENTFLSIKKMIPRSVSNLHFGRHVAGPNISQRFPTCPIPGATVPPDLADRGATATP